MFLKDFINNISSKDGGSILLSSLSLEDNKDNSKDRLGPEDDRYISEYIYYSGLLPLLREKVLLYFKDVLSIKHQDMSYNILPGHSIIMKNGFYFYNSKSDMETLFCELERHLKGLKISADNRYLFYSYILIFSLPLESYRRELFWKDKYNQTEYLSEFPLIESTVDFMVREEEVIPLKPPSFLNCNRYPFKDISLVHLQDTYLESEYFTSKGISSLYEVMAKYSDLQAENRRLRNLLSLQEAALKVEAKKKSYRLTLKKFSSSIITTKDNLGIYYFDARIDIKNEKYLISRCSTRGENKVYRVKPSDGVFFKDCGRSKVNRYNSLVLNSSALEIVAMKTLVEYLKEKYLGKGIKGLIQVYTDSQECIDLRHLNEFKRDFEKEGITLLFSWIPSEFNLADKVLDDVKYKEEETIVL